MISLNSGVVRLVLIVGATLVVSACTTASPKISTPETTSSKHMTMETGMKCSCCASMKKMDSKEGCCSGMKDGCPCCAGMSGDKGMMCAPKAKSDMSGMDHSKMNHTGTDIYAPAMKTMHENMSMAPTGNADIDFMRGMIPHHQGAIDMAKIALVSAKDPQVKKLAEDIIRSQEGEIAFMRDWLKKHGH